MYSHTRTFLISLFVLILTIVTSFAVFSCEQKTIIREEPLYYYTTSFTNMNDILVKDYPELGIGNGEFYVSTGGDILPDGTWAFSTMHSGAEDEWPMTYSTVLFTPENGVAVQTYTIECTEEVMRYDRELDEMVGTGRMHDVTYKFKAFAFDYLGRLPDGRAVALTRSPERGPDGVPTGISGGATIGNTCLSVFDENNVLESQTMLYYIDKDIVSDGFLINAYLSSDGTIWMTHSNADRDDELLAIDADGNVLYKSTLRESFSGNAGWTYSFMGVVPDTDGGLYAYFSTSAGMKNTYEMYRLADLLTPEGAKPVPLDCALDGSPDLVDGDMVYYTNSYCTYRGDTSGKLVERLVNWIDIDVPSTTITHVRLEPTGETVKSNSGDNAEAVDRITLSFFDWITYDAYMTVAERTDTPYESQKQTIKIAYEESSADSDYSDRLRGLNNLLNLASNFNRTNENYRVKLIPYTSDAGLSASQKLMRDIMSGERPDMVLFGGTITPDAFLKSDAFVDLYSFMKKDDVYTKKAFLPCVLEPFETKNGKLPYLVLNFRFETLSGLDSVIGDKSAWTISDLKELVSSLGPDEYLAKIDKTDTPSLDFFEWLLPAVVGDYVDYDRARCDFGKDFAELLEICRTAPFMSVDGRLSTENYLDGRVKLQTIEIEDMTSFMCDELLTFGNEDWESALVPHRKKTNYGASLVPDMRVSILKDTGAEDGAWTFIKHYLDNCVTQWEMIYDRPQLAYGTYGFLPTWASAEKMFEVLNDMTYYIGAEPKELENGEEGIRVTERLATYRPPEEKPDMSVEKGKKDPALNDLQRRWVSYHSAVNVRGCIRIDFSEKEETLLRDLFWNCKTPASTDRKLLAIITEEASAYFAGAVDIDRTIDQITNRVTTMLKESE